MVLRKIFVVSILFFLLTVSSSAEEETVFDLGEIVVSGNVLGTFGVPYITEVTADDIETRLVKEGLPKEGTMACHTPWGELECVCGTVFWGVIAQPEGSLWGDDATTKKNGRELIVLYVRMVIGMFLITFLN